MIGLWCLFKCRDQIGIRRADTWWKLPGRAVFETIGAELLVGQGGHSKFESKTKRSIEVDCGSGSVLAGSSDNAKLWSSQNPDSEVAALFAEAKAKRFGPEATATQGFSVGPDMQPVVAIRFKVPKKCRRGLTSKLDVKIRDEESDVPLDAFAVELKDLSSGCGSG